MDGYDPGSNDIPAGWCMVREKELMALLKEMDDARKLLAFLNHEGIHNPLSMFTMPSLN